MNTEIHTERKQTMGRDTRRRRPSSMPKKTKTKQKTKKMPGTELTITAPRRKQVC